MTTESESPSSRGGSSDDQDGISKPERNGRDSMAPPQPKKKKADTTKIVQVANIAPQTTKEQMQSLFGIVGKMEDIRLYPTMDLGMQSTSKICFIKFYDSSSVSMAQHLTNTVFIDRALVVVPFMENEIPDEQRGLELLTSGTLLPGIADPKLPQHVTSQLEGLPPHQLVATYDPKLASSKLPMYPPLPNTYDGRKIEEVRRTVMVANIDNELSAQTILDHFNQCGEVKYFRFCTRDNDPLRYALVEFTEQPSILEALKQNGLRMGSKGIKVYHATQAIVKPQAKTNEAAQKEIEDAMSRQAQTILSQGIDASNVATPHLGAPIIKEKRRSRSRHRSRDRRRSGSRNRKSRRSRSSSRRRSDYRQRSRSRGDRVSRRRSRSRDHYKRRSYSRSTSCSRRSRSRDERKKSSSSRKHRKRDKDDEKRDRDRGKDDKKDRDKEEKKDKDKEREDKKDREDRKDKRDKEKVKKKERGDRDEKTPRETERSKEEVSQNGNE